jgi:hypothetical protein
MKRLLILTLMAMLTAGAAVAENADAEGTNLVARTFQFKHKAAEKAATVIKGLLSADGTMSIQPSSNALVVTDRPENVRQVTAALAEFDTAAKQFRVTVRLVSAGRLPAGQAPRIKDDLKDVAKKLEVFGYTSVETVGDGVAETKEGEPGLLEMTGYRADFKLGEYDAASDSVRVGDFRLARVNGQELSSLMKTSLNLKLGRSYVFVATRDPKSQRALAIMISASR